MPKQSAFKLSRPAARMFIGGRATDGAGGEEPAARSAPRWTAAAARVACHAMMQVLSDRDDLRAGPGLLYHILTDAGLWQEWLAALGKQAQQRTGLLARRIFEYWQRAIVGSTGVYLRLNRARHQMKVAYDTVCGRGFTQRTMGTMFLPRVEQPDGFVAALGIDANPDSSERLPCPQGRIMQALGSWDWSGFRGTAVMVFERAAARLRDEFGSDPSPAVVERLVHRTHLPSSQSTVHAKNNSQKGPTRPTREGGHPNHPAAERAGLCLRPPICARSTPTTARALCPGLWISRV